MVTVVQDFSLENFLFGAVKLAKNADSDKYKYSDSGTGLCDFASGMRVEVFVV